MIITSELTFGQPGKDGAVAITTNTIVNNYSPVTANISSGSTSVDVLSQATLLRLCPGDLIMIYQAQGATINTSNSINYGSVSAYNSAGLYEFAYVKNILGNTINLTSPLVNSYTSSGMVQVIKVPQYTTLTINSSTSVMPKVWKDTIVSAVRYRFGGLIVVHASTILNNGTIDASGSGFRGGQLDVININAYQPNATTYVSLINSDGGEKGESIAGYQPEYDLINGRYGRGAPANGGGGGDGWNAGGGGGANGDNTNSWTGQGVMSVNGSNPATAWQLDPGYIANGNALTNSSGGGRGGYSLAFAWNNPSTTAPGNPAWGGDSRREVGGVGGRPLTNIGSAARIYFGGGGGAGDENNQMGGAGGTGGGIVYLIATTAVNGTGIISANGNNGFNTTSNGWDAPGGAGAGGSVVIKSPVIALSQNISANGGKGGDQFVTSECEGPGGGGGGGFIGLSVAHPSSVNSGIAGTTNAPMAAGLTFEGATSGATGQTALVTNTFITYNLTFTATCNSPACEGSTLNLISSLVNGGTYNWSGPNVFSSSLQNPVITNVTTAATGIYSVTVLSGIGCPSFSTTVAAVINPSPTIVVNSASICPGNTITLFASGGVTYTWMPGTIINSSITVSPSVTTEYTIRGANASGCVGVTTSTVTVGNSGSLSISGPSIICIGDSVTLSASGAGSYTWMPGGIVSSSITVFTPATQSYSVFSTVGSCTAGAAQTVSVIPIPTISISSGNLNICNGNSSVLTATGSTSYTWNPGNYVGNSFTVNPITNQTYTVVGGIGTCTSTAVGEVTVNPSVNLVLSVTSASVCYGQDLTVTANGATDYSWNPPVSLFSGNSFTLHPSTTTTYVVTGENGPCADSGTLTVFVSTVNADFTDNSSHLTVFDWIDFYNLSQNNSLNFWYFSNGINSQTSSDVSPSILFDEPGTYLACLMVKNDFGCLDTICKPITIDCPEDAVFVPNTFTPNKDNLNDIFRPLALPICIRKINFYIFDRWGEKLFTSDDLEKGWDGTYKNKLVQDDVYAYLVEYTTQSGKSYSKTGHVVVMK